MNDVVLTLDIDWAPDFVIDFVAEMLLTEQVKATWFVTHASPAVERLRSHPELFELGIHPNFLPGSSHGADAAAVLSHCLALVPEATSMRTHGLVQSTALLGQVLRQTPIRTDVSLYLPHATALRPVAHHWQGRVLWRVPYFWEDDFEMERPQPRWSLAPLLAAGEGLKVFDFHPIHVYLNATDAQPYQALKRQSPKLHQATLAEAESFRQSGAGPQTLFAEAISYLAAAGESALIREIAAR